VRKEFSADAEYIAKFEREARITASVNHPHVVKVYSFGSDHGLYYIAMELVDKGSLDDLMGLQGRVAEIQILNVGIQVAQGLQAAHQKGLIHRDVKPGNILFADAQTAKIVDFGLALLAAHEAEERGEVWGTPYYVAPEKLDHQPEDFRSDMYSLGGTLFHAMAGRPPFEADTASMVALKHLKSKAVSLQAFAPDVSSATAYVINRTLNKDPEQRYQSYAELIEHLEYAKSQLGDSGSPRKAKQRVVIEGEGQRKVAALTTLALIVVLIIGGILLYKFKDRIFPASIAAENTDDAEQAAKALHEDFELSHKQIGLGNYAGAQATLKRLNDSTIITQPMQNWVTLSNGLISLLQENPGDASEWFKVILGRAKYSNDPSDAAMVKFFTGVGTTLASSSPVSPKEGAQYSLTSFESVGPLLFGLKDWDLGQYSDAAALFKLYLASTPTEAFSWLTEFKPLAQKYVDDEAAYEQAAAIAAAADTPDKRAQALDATVALQSRAKGKFADHIGQLVDAIKKRAAAEDPIFNQRIAEVKERDATALADARRKVAAFAAEYRFDEGLAAANAAVVTGADAQKEKDGIVKTATWLAQFKAQLIADINAYGYAGQIVNRTGGQIPAGTRKANAAGLLVQTPFGTLPFQWTTLPPTALLGMASQIAQGLATSAPDKAADREWLAGVFGCEEGLSRDGHNLLIQASQVKDQYKNDLGLFIQSQ
jgi:serine/threonine protein kinase